MYAIAFKGKVIATGDLAACVKTLALAWPCLTVQRMHDMGYRIEKAQ